MPLQELVGLCMANFTKASAASSDEMGRTTVEKFIELLNTVIREPSNTYKGFTGDIVNISLNQVL